MNTPRLLPSLRGLSRFLPATTITFFLSDVERYRNTALGTVLPALGDFYSKAESELDRRDLPRNSDIRTLELEAAIDAHQMTIKAFVVGLHHLFEQQRRLMFPGGARLDKFQQLLLERTGIDTTAWACSEKLEDLRLTNNVIKHANRAVEELRERRPDLFRPRDGRLVSPVVVDWTVYIEDETLEEWLVAVETFWTTLRERLHALTHEDHAFARRLSGQMGS